MLNKNNITSVDYEEEKQHDVSKTNQNNKTKNKSNNLLIFNYLNNSNNFKYKRQI